MSDEQPAGDETLLRNAQVAAWGEEFRARLFETGIAPDYKFLQFLYIPCVETLLIEATRKSEGHERRLFARRHAERRYTLIGDPADGIHYCDPITLPHLSYAYFAVWKYENGGGDWDSIQRLHLPDYRLEQVVARGQLIAPAPYVQSWIGHLVGISADASSLTCVCGLQAPLQDGSQPVSYCLSKLDLATHHITPLTKLAGIHY